MSQTVVDEFYEQREQLGKNPSKGRALFQGSHINEWKEDPTSSRGAFFDCFEGGQDKIVGKFGALNEGTLPETSWHTDDKLDLGKGLTADHRIIANYGGNGPTASSALPCA